jgi:hypothetical protein
MEALGHTAFHEQITPWWLFETAEQIGEKNPELSDEFREFAATFTEIRDLPERKDDGLDMDNLSRYLP